MSGFVYLWRNTENGKMYLGSHKGSIDDKYIGSGTYFKRAYKKNPELFERTIIYEGEDYVEIEGYLLKLLNASKNDLFYNLTNASVGGYIGCNTEEVKKIRGLSISKAKKGKAPVCAFRDKTGDKNPMYGRNHSDETKNKIAQTRIGVSNSKKPVVEVTSGMRFERVTDAANYYGITVPTMIVLIRGERIGRGKCKNKIFNYV
jgi:group I intron endonuclease